MVTTARSERQTNSLRTSPVCDVDLHPHRTGTHVTGSSSRGRHRRASCRRDHRRRQPSKRGSRRRVGNAQRTICRRSRCEGAVRTRRRRILGRRQQARPAVGTTHRYRRRVRSQGRAGRHCQPRRRRHTEAVVAPVDPWLRRAVCSPQRGISLISALTCALLIDASGPPSGRRAILTRSRPALRMCCMAPRHRGRPAGRSRWTTPWRRCRCVAQPERPIPEAQCRRECRRGRRPHPYPYRTSRS